MYRYILFAWLTSIACSSYAADSNQLRFELRYFDYEEFSPTGTSLNRETGFIPGLAATLLRGRHGFSASMHKGRVDYDGMTQAFEPHTTKTDQTLLDLGYRYYLPVGRAEVSNPKVYLGVGYHYWLRDIQPNNNVNGLEEIYTWWTAHAGVESRLFSKDNYSLILGLGLLRTFSGTISINLKDYGFGTPVLELGDSSGANASLELHIAGGAAQYITLGIRHTQWQFGRSNSKTISNGFQTITITEPRSESAHTSIFFGLIQEF